MRKKILCIAGILALSWPALGAVPQLEPKLARGLAAVDGHAAYEYCRTLAGERFEGRLSGSPGYAAAARWAAAKFEDWRLEAPKGGFLQPYSSPYTQVDKAEMSFFVAGKESKLQPGKDFLPLLFSASGRVSGTVVFAGWGISAPELGYDDYAGVDVRGKFVLCFRGTPSADDDRFQLYDEHRVRMRTARDKGALGLIYIYPDVQANPNGDFLENFLPAVISEAAADLLFEPRKVQARELKKDLQTYGVPITFTSDARIDFMVESRHFAEGIGYNVVAYIQGSDPRLRDEYVILGAHLDHCGRHLDILFPGADDNASGSAVVMEIAHAFSAARIRPRRSILFVLFGGEEMGLLGSNHFAKNLPAPIQKISAMFNFDMEGEGDRAFVQFSQEPAALKADIERADASVQIIGGSSFFKGVGVRSSDFAPFYLQGIPCAAFYSNGPHLHYHANGDSIFRINPDIMGAIGRLGFLSTWFWAERL
jgi:hypothetical protein